MPNHVYGDTFCIWKCFSRNLQIVVVVVPIRRRKNHGIEYNGGGGGGVLTTVCFKSELFSNGEQTVQENWKPHWKSMVSVYIVCAIGAANQNMIIAATTVAASYDNCLTQITTTYWIDCNGVKVNHELSFGNILCSN